MVDRQSAKAKPDKVKPAYFLAVLIQSVLGAGSNKVERLAKVGAMATRPDGS